RAYDHVERNSFRAGAGTNLSAMPCQDPCPGKRFSSNQVDLRRLWLWRRDIAMADREDLRLQRVLERGISRSAGCAGRDDSASMRCYPEITATGRRKSCDSIILSSVLDGWDSERRFLASCCLFSAR